MEFEQLLIQWDNTQNAILVASLCGLSLTAASFLFTIKSRITSKNRALTAALTATSDSSAITELQRVIAESETDSGKLDLALKALINAFYFFLATLIIALGIDPLIDQDLATRGLPILGKISSEAGSLLPWLAADVGAYTTLITGGLYNLLQSGRTIKKVVNKS